MAYTPPFIDRADAGRRLAQVLANMHLKDPVVLALPRGGVPVAFEIAKTLHAPLDLVLVRKIGVPGYPEYGLGAVVDGAEPQVVLNDEIVRMVHPPPGYVEKESQRELMELRRRHQAYLGDRAPVLTKGHTVIVVDDGIATGVTITAALKALKRMDAARLILAIPVAPQTALDALAENVDTIICLATPDNFQAVGLHYRHFEQVTDQEVVDLLRAAEP